MGLKCHIVFLGAYEAFSIIVIFLLYLSITIYSPIPFCTSTTCLNDHSNLRAVFILPWRLSHACVGKVLAGDLGRVYRWNLGLPLCGSLLNGISILFSSGWIALSCSSWNLEGP